MDSHRGNHWGGDLVGSRVRKLFPGFGVFEGSIASFDPLKAFYKVEYDDGDREDMELHEVQQFLLQGAPSRNVPPLPSDNDQADPPAAFSSSSPSHMHSAATSSPGAPSSDVFHQTPVSKSLSLPSSEISKTGHQVNNLHCLTYLHRVSHTAALMGIPPPPLSQDCCAQILPNNCSTRRKLNDGCNGVETSLMCTRVKKARRKEKYIQTSVTSHLSATWMAPCVEDMEDDKVNAQDDMNEKTECLEDVVMYANSYTKSSQKLSHGCQDEEFFISFNEESLINGVPSAYHSVDVEYADQNSNHSATTLRPIEPPPPSSRDLSVPEDLVLDFLEIYSFLRSFSQALFLSPFSLKCFQQCLTSQTPTGLMDSIHLSLLQMLRRNLERSAKIGLAIARACLRHLDWTLLDVITWPSHLQAYLAVYDFSGTWDLKFALTKAEYYKLAVENKLALLNFLCHHVMDTDEIRAEIDTRESESFENLEEDLNGMARIHEGREFQQPECAMGGACKVEMLEKREVKEKNIDECMLCGMNGNLLCCDGCPAAYHPRCVGISRSTLPQGDWLCPECVVDGPDKKQLNPTGLRGGNLLGVDPYGQTFIAAWGYLLVIKPFTGSKVNYYNSNDLPMVVHWLEKMRPFCDPVKRRILHYWSLIQRTLPESCALAPQKIIFKLTQTCEHSQPRREALEGFAKAVANEPAVTERCALALPVLDFRHKAFDLETDGLTPRCGFKESSRIEKLVLGQPVCDYVCGHNLTEARADTYSSDKSIKSDGAQQDCQYTNHYSQGDAAATAAASLATQIGKRKARKNPFNEQLQAFCKSSVQFYWPSVHKQSIKATDEKCGWCFCCTHPNMKKGCILNQAAGILAAGAARVPGGIRPTNFGLGHLPTVAGYLLHIEANLKALLEGPWQDVGFRKRWRKKVKHAAHVNDLKRLLLQLETCLRPVLLSGKWFNDQEKVPSLTCKRFLEDTASANRACKKLECVTSVQTPRLHTVEALLLQSWKHGKNSKKIFQWYLLPSYVARQAARQGGLKKIQGLVYSEELDWASRNKRCAWQVRVEAACTVSQLALQVRCLDAYIRWDDLQSRSVDAKTNRSPKSGTIYAKKWEGNVPIYLIDLETIKHSKKASKVVPSEDTSKVWVTDTQIPLSLLKNFEERLWLIRHKKHCKDKVSKSWLKTCHTAVLDMSTCIKDVRE